jgi:uncharacterized membrane protein
MKSLNQIFLKGLIVVLPVTLTFYLLYWASVKVESLFASTLQWLLGRETYIPGLGIVVTIMLVFIVGVLVSNFITARFFKFFTDMMEKVPLIKAIYNPLKDLMALIPGRGDAKNPQKVVLVPLEGMGVQALGLVTRDQLDEIPGSDLIAVYIPLSYMLGGITVLVDRHKVVKVDIPVDQAIKLSVTAWIKATPEAPRS